MHPDANAKIFNLMFGTHPRIIYTLRLMRIYIIIYTTYLCTLVKYIFGIRTRIYGVAHKTEASYNANKSLSKMLI